MAMAVIAGMAWRRIGAVDCGALISTLVVGQRGNVVCYGFGRCAKRSSSAISARSPSVVPTNARQFVDITAGRATSHTAVAFRPAAEAARGGDDPDTCREAVKRAILATVGFELGKYEWYRPYGIA